MSTTALAMMLAAVCAAAEEEGSVQVSSSAKRPERPEHGAFANVGLNVGSRPVHGPIMAPGACPNNFKVRNLTPAQPWPVHGRSEPASRTKVPPHAPSASLRLPGLPGLLG